jgi:hypothetical protein
MTEDQMNRLEELLTKNLASSEKTYMLLRSINRMSWISSILKYSFWFIILVLPFFFIKPILNTLSGFLPGLTSSTPMNMSGLPSQQEIQKALEIYKQVQKASQGK